MTVVIDGTTGTDKVVDGSIATVDLADGAVTTAKIADGQITQAKLSMTVAPVYADVTDYYASSTIVGWSSLTAGRRNITYQKTGKRVDVWFHLEGTSNSTSTTFTLPYTSSNQYGAYGAALSFTYDNGGYSSGVGRCALPGASTTVTCHSGNAATALWTASGTKIVSGSFFYFTDS